MQNKDKKEFATKMALIAEVFDDAKPPTKLKIDIYFKALEKYPIEAISSAVSSIIQNRVFPSFPKPAEIIQEIEGKRENRATEAWMMVIGTVRRIGNYQSVAFADPVIHSVIVQMGGWPQFCAMLVDDERWKQKEFERLYNVIAEFPRAAHVKYLPGTVEIENGYRGYENKNEIVKIGFERGKIKLIDVKGS